MNWLSFAAIYFVVWFLALFIVLPIGVRREVNPQIGHDLGAPEKAYMWRKAIGAIVISLLITSIIWWSFDFGLISFK